MLRSYRSAEPPENPIQRPSCEISKLVTLIFGSLVSCRVSSESDSRSSTQRLDKGVTMFFMSTVKPSSLRFLLPSSRESGLTK